MISLLFFLCDHYRFYELKDKVKSSAYLAASMVQQITNNRTNKQLTITDLGRITYASFLNFFHLAKEMYVPMPLGLNPRMGYFWVKKTADNTYQYQVVESRPNTNKGYDDTSSLLLYKEFHEVTTKTETQVKELLPDLVCDNIGDEKAVIWAVLQQIAGTFTKEKAGFFVMPIKGFSGFGFSDAYVATVKGHFQYKLVFTPKPGLFPITK